MNIPHPVPWELKAVGVTRDQFLEDWTTVEGIVCGIPANGQPQLETLTWRYQYAPPPTQGHRAAMWYRFRRLVWD